MGTRTPEVGRAVIDSAPGGRRKSDLREVRKALQRIGPAIRIPASTYRLQFNAEVGFGFREAANIVPYLHDLGISDIYASPYLQARSGSTHGYDVADPGALNPALGSEEDFRAMVTALRGHGMGQLVDVVPNHMGIGDPANYRWLDVLENGPASVYARFFDVDWQPLKAELQDDRNKVILPILGGQYGQVLEAKELRVELEAATGSFWVRYWDHRFPLAPDSYPRLLEPCLEELYDTLGRRHEQAQELASITAALRHLPPRVPALDDTAREERDREKEIVKRRLRLLYESSPAFQQALGSAIESLNGSVGDRSSFDRLDALLSEQSYRLAYWRVASEEINYRRFFDITELAAVRIEDPSVFRETHDLLLKLVGEGLVDGLRIDHPDGLLDPAGYFVQLQEACFARRYAAPVAAELGLDRSEAETRLKELFDRERHRAGSTLPRVGCYVVAEKILAADEQLPSDWLVHGTTGYDFLNLVGGLFVATDKRRTLEGIYGRFTGESARFRDLVNSRKKMVMLISLASEVNELAYMLKALASSDRRHRDFTLMLLVFAIREVIAALPVYRTYVDPTTGEASAPDRGYLDLAVTEAKRRNPRTDPSLFDFVRASLLLGEELLPEDHVSAERAARLRFIGRFQQTTGPVMAKGVEDTAFYVYNRLVSLNEVGGDPDRFGVTLQQFHRGNARRNAAWPSSLLTTTTHDTKRSEDVRARISVLSEVPGEWRSALNRWARMNARLHARVEGKQVPDANEEYLLYQTLLGTWPFGGPASQERDEYVQRIQAFMTKSLKEAKVNTSWINPNGPYEEAVQAFVADVLDPDRSAAFLADFQGLAAKVTHFGVFNALSQTVLKLAAPGVPDIYQGNELWDLSLVDPDNRRPVDYAPRQTLLADLTNRAGDPRGRAKELVATREDGRIKLWVTYRALQLRRERPELFGPGSRYRALRVRGPSAAHVAAFLRSKGDQHLVVVAPVQVATLLGGVEGAPIGAEVWRNDCIRVPGGRYRSLFSGEKLQASAAQPTLPLAEVLGVFPVALLVLEDSVG